MIIASLISTNIYIYISCIYIDDIYFFDLNFFFSATRARYERSGVLASLNSVVAGRCLLVGVQPSRPKSRPICRSVLNCATRFSDQWTKWVAGSARSCPWPILPLIHCTKLLARL